MRFLVLLIPLSSLAVCGADQARPLDEWFAHSKDRAWLQAYDPTLITQRAMAELSYHDLGGDDTKWRLEPSIRWPVPLQENLALGFQLMTPIEWKDAGGEESMGFSDIEFKTGIVGHLNDTLRFGTALNVVFDSAHEDTLGVNALVLRPIAAVRWDVADHINMGMNVEYNFTPRDEGSDDASALQLEFPVAFKLSKHWSAAVSYKPRWNLLADTDRHRLQVAATAVWGRNHEYALTFGPEVPLKSEPFNWKLETAFS